MAEVFLVIEVVEVVEVLESMIVVELIKHLNLVVILIGSEYEVVLLIL